MTSPILLTGGTGTLGRHVLARLVDAGQQVRVLSRKTRSRDNEITGGVEFVTGELATGEGLDAAVAGLRTIVHCAGEAKGDEDKARHVVEAASSAGVRHIVFVSVVGADRVPVVSGIDRAMFGYFASKLAAERLIADSGIPHSTLRATQFHDFVPLLAEQMSKSPVWMSWAGVRFQPVDAAEVAERLVELALGQPAGRVPDLGGPRTYPMADMLRDYLRSTGRRRLVVPVRAPGRAAHAFREGVNLAPDRAVGQRTWEDHLAERVPATRRP